MKSPTCAADITAYDLDSDSFEDEPTSIDCETLSTCETAVSNTCAANPAKPVFTFYSSREISPRNTRSDDNDKQGKSDTLFTRSPYLGCIATRDRGFVIHQTKRSGGLFNGELYESDTINFCTMACSRFMKDTLLHMGNKIQDSIVFYRLERELDNVLNCTYLKRTKLSDFANPYRHNYAIQFSEEGSEMLQLLLAYDNASLQDTLTKFILSKDSFFNLEETSELYPIKFGEVFCVNCLIPDLTAIGGLQQIIENGSEAERYAIICPRGMEHLFKKYFPNAQMLPIPFPKASEL